MKLFRLLALFVVSALLCLEASALDQRLVGFWVRATAGVPSARWTLSANGTGIYEVDFGPEYPGFVLTNRITNWNTNAANNTFTYTVDHQSASGNGPYNYDEQLSPPKTYSTPYTVTGTTNKIWAIEDYTYAQAASVTDGTVIPAAALDKSYGTDGFFDFSTLASGGFTLEPAAAALNPKDGKVLVLSRRRHSQEPSDFAISRFNIDGTPDPTFNGNGTRITDFGSDAGYPACITIDPLDGKIVVAGNTAGAIAVARYTTKGEPDTALNGSGMLLTDVGEGEHRAADVTIQPDRKIVVVGGTPTFKFLMLRYLSDGTLDASFNGTGRAEITNGHGSCVALQPDGKIVVGGNSDLGYTIWRFNPDGTLDTTFNADGIQPGRFGIGNYRFGKSTGYPSCYNVSIRPSDGKIIAGGSIYLGNGMQYLLLTSNNPDGTPDDGFGAGGRIVEEVSTGYTDGFFGWQEYKDGYADELTLQPDGKIVVSTIALTGDTPDTKRGTFLMRYNVDGTPDTTFNGTGKAFVDIYGHSGSEQGLMIQPADGKIVFVSSYGIGRAFGRDYSPPNRKAYHTVTVGRVPAAKGMVKGTGGFPAGTKVTLKAKAKKGYDFAGWKEKGKLVSTKSPYIFVVKGNRVLVAVFKKE